MNSASGPSRSAGNSVYSPGLRERWATDGRSQVTTTEQIPTAGPIARYEQGIIERISDFNDPRQEWRRLFAELLGTFFLVLAAAGGG